MSLTTDPRLPDRAPRGKQFAVVHHDHVAGGPRPIESIVRRERYDALQAAELLAQSIDWRLMPLVIIVDKERP